VLALVFSLFITSQGAAQNPPRRADTRAWYQAYSDGTKAIQQGKWQEGIDSLEAAKRAGAPKPGRKVPSYGDNFVDFIPDYYLGIAYLNLKQYVQADRAFAAVRASGLIGPRDREYGEFDKQATVARAEVNRTPAVANAAPAAGAVTNAAANPPPAAPAGAVQQQPPTGVQQQNVPANAATTAAVQQAPAQTTPPPLPGQSPPLRSNVPAAVPGRSAANAVASPAVVRPPAPPPITPRQTAPVNEQAAIVAYLSGQYDQVSTLLGGAIAANAGTPRAYFYLACSQTALAILGRSDANAVNEARTLLARAGDPAQFAADRRYISPRVLQMLGLNP
jgi:hypothetical protein